MRKFQLQALLVAVYIVLLPFALAAQPDTWAKSFGSKGAEIPGDVVTDANGYIYVAGNYKDSLKIGNQVLACAGGNDYFVAKFKPTGDLVWVTRFGDTSSEYAYGIALDGDHLYLAGNFRDSTDFGPEKIFTNYQGGNFDMFVIRMDTSGNYVWNKSSKGPGGEFPTSISVNSQGLAFVTGYYRIWSFFFGQPDTIYTANFEDMFLFRMNDNRKVQFYEDAGGEFYESGQEVRVYQDTILFVTGYFEDTCYFNDSSFSLASTGKDEQPFIAEYDWNGDFKWAKKFDAPTWAIPAAMDIDGAGNMYIVGTYDSAFTAGSTTINPSGNLDGFIMKTDKSGNALWLKNVGYNGFDAIKDVVVEPSGNIFITGYFQDQLILGNDTLNAADENDSEAFFAGLDASGNYLWANRGGGVSLDEGHKITADPTGFAIAMGTFIDEAFFGQAVLESHGSDDLFLIKINQNGQVDRNNLISMPTLEIFTYPNPTDRIANFVFELPQSGKINLDLFDLKGQKVRSWANQLPLGKGRNEIEGDLTGLKTGVYVYTLEFNGSRFAGKLVMK